MASSSDPLQSLASRPGDPTWEVAYLFPAQGDWTEEEYLALDTNRLVELSDGRLEVLRTPTVLHQLIVQCLHGLLLQYVKPRRLGTVLFAPLPVRLGPKRFREPDVVYLRAERSFDVRRQPEGADLVMEVVSEGLNTASATTRSSATNMRRPASPNTGLSIRSNGGSWRSCSKAPCTACTASSIRATMHTGCCWPGFQVPVAEVFAAGSI